MIRRLACILALVASLGAFAAPQLVVPYDGPVAKTGKAKPFKSQGSRIQFNLAALRTLVPGQEAELTLPDGTEHAIVFDLIEDKGDGITSWIGHYKDATPVLRTIITTGPAGTFGRITTPDNEYAIMPGEGHDWLVDMAAEKPFMPPIHLERDMRVRPHGKEKSAVVPQSAEPPQMVEPVPGVNTAAVPKSAAAVSTPPLVTIDVLMAYTSGLAATLGTAGVQTRMQQLIASANTTFADSGVGIALRLVRSVQVSYSDTAKDSEGALYDITPGVQANVDPAFATIDSLRTQYGADIVTLLRNGYSTGGDGIAWVPTGPVGAGMQDQMYSVMTGCTASCDWVWVHEVGHNLGSAHDRATNAWEHGGANEPGSFSYSYGYYSCQGGRLALSCAAFSGGCTGGSPECSTPAGGTNNFTDIMAYLQGSTTKNIVFSNPALNCQGSTGPAAPCGSNVGQPDEANAALTLNNNRSAVAALYPTKVGGPTTTSLASAPNPSNAGQGVTFTATVTSSSGTPTGNVAFSADGSTISGCGAVALNGSGVATCGPLATLGVGSHAIVAQYAGNATFNASSASRTQTVNIVKVTPAVSVGMSPNPATAGQAVTLSASVTGSNGTATGGVTFSNNGTTLCANAGLAGGTATCVTSALAAGTQTVTASYGGDSAYNPGTGSNFFVVRAATAIALSTSANPASSGQPVVITASLSSALAGTFTGTVSFSANGAAIGACSALTVTSSAATCNTAGLGLGDSAITAQYSGSATFAPAVAGPFTQSVRGNSSVALGTSLTPSNLRQVLTFTATVTGSGAAPSGAVVFKDGSTTINGCASASIFNGVAKCVTSGLASGSHSITASYGGDTRFFASSSTALAQSVTTTVQSPPAGGAKRLDFNGDGKSDIVWQNIDGSVSLWLMDGTSIAAHGAVFPASAGAVTRSGDFNGDGKVDFVRQLADGSTSITYMNGLDVIAGGPLVRGATSARLINVGDFNGDGITDLVFRNADNSVEMWLMSASAAPTVATIMPATSGWSLAKIGDFDGDGRDDILWSNTDGTTSMWLMNGSAVVQRGAIMPTGSIWRAAWIADFDHDGDDDIVWVNTVDGSVSMWLMNGLTIAQRGPLMGAGSGWSVALAADFDGDGRSDLVWRKADGSVSLWLMNGLAAASKTSIFSPGNPWTPAQATDANGDGHADFLWAKSDGTVGLWLMNGSAMIDHRTIMDPTAVWSVATTVEQNR